MKLHVCYRVPFTVNNNTNCQKTFSFEFQSYHINNYVFHFLYPNNCVMNFQRRSVSYETTGYECRIRMLLTADIFDNFEEEQAVSNQICSPRNYSH